MLNSVNKTNISSIPASSPWITSQFTSPSISASLSQENSNYESQLKHSFNCSLSTISKQKCSTKSSHQRDNFLYNEKHILFSIILYRCMKPLNFLSYYLNQTSAYCSMPGNSANQSGFQRKYAEQNNKHNVSDYLPLLGSENDAIFYKTPVIPHDTVQKSDGNSFSYLMSLPSVSPPRSSIVHYSDDPYNSGMNHSREDQIYFQSELQRIRHDLSCLKLQNMQMNIHLQKNNSQPIIIQNQAEFSSRSNLNCVAAQKGNFKYHRSGVNGTGTYIFSWLSRFLDSRLNQFMLLIILGFGGYILSEHHRQSWRLAMLKSRLDSNVIHRGFKLIEEAFGVRR